MKILVTGGTGVIGNGMIPQLLLRGHRVRLLSRHACEDAEAFAEDVEGFSGDVTDASSIKGATEGCDCVIHIAGIVEERPPEVTYKLVNVAGTKALLNEAENEGMPYFIYVSSLGADRGSSDYHKSKLEAEELVKKYSGPWLIIRPGNIYGPGDEVISMLLKMVRALPAIPVVEDGEQPFQPIWYKDFGAIVAAAAEREDLDQEILEVAGTEVTTTNEIISRLAAITGREPKRVEVPQWVAEFGTKTLEAGNGVIQKFLDKMGLGSPLSTAKLRMLLEENTLEESRNGLGLFNITYMTLNEGLQSLVDTLPEQTLENGVGSIERKTYWADISGSDFIAADLLEKIFKDISRLMPVEFGLEPGANGDQETYTAVIPGRGNVQIRLLKRTTNKIVFATIEGHPLAGMLVFAARDTAEGITFEIQTMVRAANVFDWMAMRTVGRFLQNQNWHELVSRVIEESGGAASKGIQSNRTILSQAEAEQAEEWLSELVRSTKRRKTEEVIS